MKRQIDDETLGRILDRDRVDVGADHIRRVRSVILVAAHDATRLSWTAIFGFRPALLIATGLLGFVLGVSVPALGNVDAASTAVLQDQPQSFLTGDFG